MFYSDPVRDFEAIALKRAVGIFNVEIKIYT